MRIGLPVLDGKGIGGKLFDGQSGDFTSVHEDPSLVSRKENSVVSMVADVHDDTVCIGDLGFEVDWHIKSAECYWVFRGTLELHWQRVDRPLRDIDVMSSPVGHLSAGVFPPPSKGVVATFFGVGDIGSLALPEVPVQMLRDRSLVEGSTGDVLS